MNKINVNGWCYMPDIDRSNESIIVALNNKSDIDLGNTILNDSIDPTNTKPVSGSSVYQEFLDLLGNAPETLNTLNKLAQAINNDPNFFTTINNLLNLKANNNTVVHKTDNESISGTKTFTNTINGNISGNAATSTKLQTARTIRTNLASTSTASFNGTTNVTPGVTGILPIANGGTGNSSGKAADSTKWNGASKTVSTAAPSGGANGDIWFQYIN